MGCLGLQKGKKISLREQLFPQFTHSAQRDGENPGSRKGRPGEENSPMKESSWERLGQDRHGRPTQDLGLQAWTQGHQNSREEASTSAHGQWIQAHLESLCFSGPSLVLPEELAPENQACCLAPSRLPL